MTHGKAQSGHLRVQQSIRKRILDGTWGVGAKIPAERELELELGISRLTISKGLAHLVAEGLLTRRRGQGTFVTDQSQQTRHKGLWVKSISPMAEAQGGVPVKHGVMEGLYDAVGGSGFQVGVDFYRTPAEQIALLDRPHDPRTGGLIIWFEPAADSEAALARLQERGVPFVLLDAYSGKLESDYVVSDNLEGGRLLVEHLVAMGHRQIGYVSRPIDRTSLRDRQAGFLQGVVTHGLPLQAGQVVQLTQPGEAALAEVPLTVEHLLALTPRPTALCFCNDDLALEAVDYLRKKGIRVPQDLSVVGYDNVDRSKYGLVPLTTVQQDFYGMGKAAGEVLGERLNGAGNGRPNQLSLKPELVVRESVSRISTAD
ncbi:MAG: GntR family transcriptional regulator [Lentisphaeria bacterium]